MKYGFGIVNLEELTEPVPNGISEYDRWTGVEVTWTPKNEAVLRNVSLTVEFVETISVATPVESEPAWIRNLSNVILCKWNSTFKTYVPNSHKCDSSAELILSTNSLSKIMWNQSVMRKYIKYKMHHYFIDSFKYRYIYIYTYI